MSPCLMLGREGDLPSTRPVCLVFVSDQGHTPVFSGISGQCSDNRLLTNMDTAYPIHIGLNEVLLGENPFIDPHFLLPNPEF